MSEERSEWIDQAYRASLTTQSYAPGRSIDGVRVEHLTLFSDAGGDFCEITRLDDDGCLRAFPGYRPAQISYSLMEVGTIKAWHLHRSQDDLWFVPPHRRVLVGLLDVRPGSPTTGTDVRLTLGVGAATLLLVPRGVAHGIANVGSNPAVLIYFANRSFDRDNPDEHRLPYDLLGADYWSPRPE